MKNCPVCQAENTDDVAYCQDCGADLSGVAAAASTPEATVAAPSAPLSSAGPDEGLETLAAILKTGSTASSGPHLVVASTGQSLMLTKRESVIGREDPTSGIFPDIDTSTFGGLEGGVSRKHARIYEQNGTYFIEDLNSTNYTLVNKQKVLPAVAQALAAGDEVRLGRISLLFML